MRNSKFFFLLVLVLSTAVFAAGCSAIQTNDKSEQLPDGLYFMKWDAYHGYFADEEPHIQLSLMEVGRDRKQKDTSQSLPRYVLLSDQGEIFAGCTGFTPISKSQRYTVDHLGLTLPKLTPGKYVIDRLRIEESGKQVKTYPIGRWVIDVREGSQPADLKQGKCTLGSSCFDWYVAELTNGSKNDVDSVRLDFQLESDSYKTVLKTFTDFKMQTRLDDMPCLSPGETKAFLFEFIGWGKNEHPPKFISIRPFLSYVDGDQSKLMALPAAIYAPSSEEILHLVQDMQTP